MGEAGNSSGDGIGCLALVLIFVLILIACNDRIFGLVEKAVS